MEIIYKPTIHKQCEFKDELQYLYYEEIISAYDYLTYISKIFDEVEEELTNKIYRLENKKIKYFFNYRENKRLKNIEKYKEEIKENVSSNTYIKSKIKDLCEIVDNPFVYDLKHAYDICNKKKLD